MKAKTARIRRPGVLALPQLKDVLPRAVRRKLLSYRTEGGSHFDVVPAGGQGPSGESARSMRDDIDGRRFVDTDDHQRALRSVLHEWLAGAAMRRDQNHSSRH